MNEFDLNFQVNVAVVRRCCLSVIIVICLTQISCGKMAAARGHIVFLEKQLNVSTFGLLRLVMKCRVGPINQEAQSSRGWF